MCERNREIPNSVRKIVIDLWRKGKSYSMIATTIGKTRATIQYIVKQFKTTGSYKIKPRSGRPKKLTVREEASLLRKVSNNPKLSAPQLATALKDDFSKVVNAQTVRNCLHRAGYNGRIARRKPFISEQNRKKRLDFAKEYVTKPVEFWENVIFTDETKINIFGSDGRTRVWRKTKTAFKLEHLCPTIKHGGGNVLIWGCMSASGVGNFTFIEGTMDQHVYLNILREQFMPSIQKLGLEGRYMFQQDNDPKHTAKLVQEWLIHNVRQQLRTPPQSPDINPIEHLWEELKRRVRKTEVSTKEELKARVTEEWNNIPREVTRKLVHSMPNRLRAIIKANGYATKY